MDPDMNQVPSFQIDHIRMKRGIFVSRKDFFGDVVLTTFDLRFKEPNREPVMDIPALHTIEHLGATYLRTHPVWKTRTVYFGPMGCRTGSYMILQGDLKAQDAVDIVKGMFDFILSFRGDVPAASALECGNWRDHNLDMAQWEARKYKSEVLDRLGPENLNYPS